MALNLFSDETLEENVNHEIPGIGMRMEYVVVFYGGERLNLLSSEWEMANGLRIVCPLNSDKMKEFERCLHEFVIHAIEITAEYYHDVMIMAKTGLLSTTLPKSTIISKPESEEEMNEHFDIYIHQMTSNNLNVNVFSLCGDKEYTDEQGKLYQLKIKRSGDKMIIDPILIVKSQSPEKNVKSGFKWKFW